ncbi:MFS family permease [Agromyces terreus]|uniref:MFS family permease n=1 Tax=Agromyces terreus TaxID=424795 RepID=A0A9X2KCD3_9MICO|nr:MFS transporter [Agromyces terreus]MCP2372323.1 MFS family permease [Agromyces terreus]
MTVTTPSFSWRSIVLPAYLPTLLFSIGEGAIIPVIPVVATERGASIALAGLIAAMIMVGELLGDLPAGWLVARIGERASMIGASALAAIGVLVALLSPTLPALGIGILLVGLATAVFGLARHAFLTSYVPERVRARALSTLAGVFRGGWAVGPFIAAALLATTGASENVFWVLVAACLVVVVVLLVLPDPERVFGSARQTRAEASDAAAASRAPGGAEATESPGRREADAASHGVFRAIATHRAVLARIGTGVGLLAALRASRMVILPLWAVSIGMAPEAAALVIGVSATIDFALFYVSGQVMDRFGRLWSAIPGLLGLGVGHLVLAFTRDSPAAGVWFTVIALLFGVANGLSSGVILTLGADLAPKANPAPFLGAFRTIADAGQAGAPLAIAALISASSIMVASATMGVLGFVGAAILWRYVPRYVPHAGARPPGKPVSGKPSAPSP